MLKQEKVLFYFPIFLVIYEFSVYMANDMIMPGMIEVTKDFNANLSVIPISLSAFLLGGSSLQILIGPISDRYGRRIIMLYGVLFFMISTFFIAFSYSMNSFFIARFLQGMGLCFIGVIGYASIQEMYDEKPAIRIIALMAMASLLAPLLGPLFGGVFIEYFHWRYIFIFIGILTIISFIGLYAYMPETAHFNYIKERVFVKKADLSIVPPLNIRNFFSSYYALFRNKKFILGTLSFSLYIVPLLCWISISPIVLEHKYHLKGFIFGLVQVPLFGAMILGNLILRKITKKFSLNRLIIYGSIFCLVGVLISFICTFYLKDDYLNLIIPLSIYCFGLGILAAPLNRKILFSTSVAKGTASALLSILNTLILVLSTSLMPLVYGGKNDFYLAIFNAMCVTIAFLCGRAMF